MHVRAATAADIGAMMQLESAEPSLAHWSERQYYQVLSSPPQRLAFVAEEGALLGFVVAQLAEDCEIENIIVAREHRQQGIARALLREIEIAARNAGAQRILLEVRESNAAARSFYASCGFREQGRRRSYYSAPEEDAVLMAMGLAPAPA